MRPSKALRQMAGLEPTPHDRQMLRMLRQSRQLSRLHLQELRLLDMLQRRQRGDEGAPPMPFAKMRADLEKMGVISNDGPGDDVAKRSR